jgi:HipA-like C-terminal domain
MPYPIFDVTKSTIDRPEALGTKEKFWLVPSAETGLTVTSYLFKIGRPHTGENWSEKVCCEILRTVDVPCAAYDFAVHGGDAGVISKQFVPVNGQFVPANMLLEGAVKGYDGQLRFRQRKYQLSTSLNLIKLRSIGLPHWTPANFTALSAVEMFVGYLVFDVLVSNTDRHHENWGVVVDYSDRYSPSYRLAPTFDHASSLGRNENDAARTRRLTTRDERDTVEAYASRARSAFYGSATSNQTLRQTEVLENLIRSVPEATRHWATVFSTIPQNVYEDIFARIEPKLISKQATDFALRMLHANSATLRSVI